MSPIDVVVLVLALVGTIYGAMQRHWAAALIGLALLILILGGKLG